MNSGQAFFKRQLHQVQSPWGRKPGVSFQSNAGFAFGMPPEFFFDAPEATPGAAALDVAQLLREVKAELSELWGEIRVQGELRSFKAYPSGHIYFDLRDRKEDALLSCVLFRRDAQRLSFRPKVGDLVELRGSLNIYEPRGQLNFIARHMKPAGAGDLFAQFQALKEKLAAQGLFAPQRKKPLPLYPDVIGIVTSPEAAALRDAVRTLRLKAPWVKIILYPASVQGDAAEGEIMRALEAAAARREVDVLLLIRGGGSIADLWSFNSEGIAQTLARMPMPVISGVGHEVDFTIADFVSDVRAATPTAAANLAVEHWVAAAQRLETLNEKMRARVRGSVQLAHMRLERADRLSMAYKMLLQQARARLSAAGDVKRLLTDYLDRLAQRLDGLQADLDGGIEQRLAQLERRLVVAKMRLVARRPDARAQQLALRHAQEALMRAALQQINSGRERLKALSLRLDALDVAKVLARGYALALGPDGSVVREAQKLSKGDALTLVFSSGRAQASVTGVDCASRSAQKRPKNHLPKSL